jgi:hypothetical protein
MKKLFIISLVVMTMVFGSCNDGSSPVPKKSDTVTTAAGPDSAANNEVLPPSTSPGDANNSSLADTAYKAKDSAKSKKK